MSTEQDIDNAVAALKVAHADKEAKTVAKHSADDTASQANSAAAAAGENLDAANGAFAAAQKAVVDAVNGLE